MTWFKVDDQLHAHPKWVSLSPEARALWTTAGSWCARYLTDGYVPGHVLPMLGGKGRDAAELERTGLWEAAGDGWRFHDWADFQPSADQVTSARASARQRQQRFRKAHQSQERSRRDAERDVAGDTTRDVAGDAAVTSRSPYPYLDNNTSSDKLTTRRDTSDDDDESNSPKVPDIPSIVGQAIAVLATRDLADRQAAPGLSPVGDPTRYQETAYDRRLKHAGPLVKLAAEHPDWTAEQLADFAEPRPVPTANGARPDPRATAYDEQQATERARAEAHMRERAAAPPVDVETDGRGLAAAKAALRQPPPTEGN